MDKLETLRAMRSELLERVDALDYCIRMLENLPDFDGNDSSDTETRKDRKPAKKRAGSTEFSIQSRTKPAVIPNHDGGILLWESETDDEFHG